MSQRRFPIDDFELPSGGLAEEVMAAEATAVSEREEPNDAAAGAPATIEEVEFFFLAPEGIEKQEARDEPEADELLSPELIAFAEEDVERPRTVEEALANDFLFAFDQRDLDDEEGLDRFDETAEDQTVLPPCTSPRRGQGMVADAEIQDDVADIAPFPLEDEDDDGFSLTPFRADREELEREIGKLRRDLERHRSMLLELRDGSSLLLPAPTSRRPDASNLPATADVLAGMTTVAEPEIDFRNTEEFRAALPKLSALLGLESADETLLKPVGGEQEPNFRALALIGRPRVPRIETEALNLPAVRPAAIGLATADVHDVEPMVERATNEIIIPVKWWNAIPAVAFFVLLATGIGFLNVGAVGQINARAMLSDALHSAPIRVADLQANVAAIDGTFLARFDGRFDYIRARVQDFVNFKNNSQELLSTRRLIDPRVLKLVDRAVERVPALGWQRLTRAALATAAKTDDAEDSWVAAAAARIDDSLYWEVLGDHYRMTGRKDDAIAMFTNVLRRRPGATRDMLALLSEVRVDLNKSLAIVPRDPVAVLQAVLFVRNEEGRREWTAHADELLERLGPPQKGEDGDDLAARGQLLILLDRGEAAAGCYEAALKCDLNRNDFRLALAKLRYEQKRFDEADALAERIVHSEPASAAGEEARVLRNKIELATSGRRPGRVPVAH